MTDQLDPDAVVARASRDLHRSHLRLAERMAAQHAGRLRYAHGLGWLAWDGTRWRPDDDGEPVRCAVDVVKRALAEADRNSDQQLDKAARECESSHGVRGVVCLAQHLRPLAVAAHRLDADPYLLNVRNGTLDLRTGELRRHDPDDLLTKTAGCGYDPDAAGPTFSRFVTDVLPDPDVRGFVQRLCGYALLGKVTEHVLPVLTGDGGNGKTTLVETVLKAFGDYGITCEPDLLVDHGHAHPTGQADLLGARLAVTTETDEGRRLAAATVKRLTGGDSIRARKMRQDFFEFAPSHTVVMVTNHKPRVNADDQALWRRLRIVPFEVVVSEPDETLPDRLALELPYVLAWCVAGWRDYQQRGLDAPTAVTDRTDAYRTASDTLGRFLDECTTTADFASTPARDLYRAWCDWCQTSGEPSTSERDFADAMSRRGHHKRKSDGVMRYQGLALTSHAREGQGGSTP